MQSTISSAFHRCSLPNVDHVPAVQRVRPLTSYDGYSVKSIVNTYENLSLQLNTTSCQDRIWNQKYSSNMSISSQDGAVSLRKNQNDGKRGADIKSLVRSRIRSYNELWKQDVEQKVHSKRPVVLTEPIPQQKKRESTYKVVNKFRSDSYKSATDINAVLDRKEHRMEKSYVVKTISKFEPKYFGNNSQIDSRGDNALLKGTLSTLGKYGGRSSAEETRRTGKEDQGRGQFGKQFSSRLNSVRFDDYYERRLDAIFSSDRICPISHSTHPVDTKCFTCQRLTGDVYKQLNAAKVKTSENPVKQMTDKGRTKQGRELIQKERIITGKDTTGHSHNSEDKNNNLVCDIRTSITDYKEKVAIENARKEKKRENRIRDTLRYRRGDEQSKINQVSNQEIFTKYKGSEKIADVTIDKERKANILKNIKDNKRYEIEHLPKNSCTDMSQYKIKLSKLENEDLTLKVTDKSDNNMSIPEGVLHEKNKKTIKTQLDISTDKKNIIKKELFPEDLNIQVDNTKCDADDNETRKMINKTQNTKIILLEYEEDGIENTTENKSSLLSEENSFQNYDLCPSTSYEDTYKYREKMNEKKNKDVKQNCDMEKYVEELKILSNENNGNREMEEWNNHDENDDEEHELTIVLHTDKEVHNNKDSAYFSGVQESYENSDIIIILNEDSVENIDKDDRNNLKRTHIANSSKKGTIHPQNSSYLYRSASDSRAIIRKESKQEEKRQHSFRSPSTYVSESTSEYDPIDISPSHSECSCSIDLDTDSNYSYDNLLYYNYDEIEVQKLSNNNEIIEACNPHFSQDNFAAIPTDIDSENEAASLESTDYFGSPMKDEQGNKQENKEGCVQEQSGDKDSGFYKIPRRNLPNKDRREKSTIRYSKTFTDDGFLSFTLFDAKGRPIIKRESVIDLLAMDENDDKMSPIVESKDAQSESVESDSLPNKNVQSDNVKQSDNLQQYEHVESAMPTEVIMDDKHHEHKAANSKKMAAIISELKHSEKYYIMDSLRRVVKDYMPEMDRPDIPKNLIGKRNVIFGNILLIYNLHKTDFYPKLRICKSVEDIAICFLENEDIFSLYPRYSQNKPKSDKEYRNCSSYFKRKQIALLDPLDLASYLLVPIQRLGKYILLLRNLLKECENAGEVSKNLEKALEMLEEQMQLGNDLIAVDCIKGTNFNLKDQGKLLLRDAFTVWTSSRKHAFEAMIFLFEELLLITNIINQNDIFMYKDSIRMEDLGFTYVQYDNLEFKIWFRKHDQKVYTLRTKQEKTKHKWADKINDKLWKQLLDSKSRLLDEQKNINVNYICTDIETNRRNSTPQSKNKKGSLNYSSSATKKEKYSSTAWYTDHFLK